MPSAEVLATELDDEATHGVVAPELSRPAVPRARSSADGGIRGCVGGRIPHGRAVEGESGFVG